MAGSWAADSFSGCVCWQPTACDACSAPDLCAAMTLLLQVPTGLEIVGKVFEFTKWP
jgi:hypothetical protein